MNEINFVLDKINNKNYLESNISDNKKIKEIVSISFQLYLINELYKNLILNKYKPEQYISLYSHKSCFIFCIFYPYYRLYRFFNIYSTYPFYIFYTLSVSFLTVLLYFLLALLIYF